jgi:catecholate siderophore receptor
MCSAATAATQVPVTANNPYFPVAGTPVGSVYVLRDRPSGSGTIKTAMNDLDFKTRFVTGALSHTMIFGAEYDDERADLVRFANQDTVIPPVPLLAPDPFQDFPGTQTDVTQKPATRTHTVGVYTTDTVGFGPHWDLTAAIRYDSFHASFDQPLGNATSFDHTDNIWSPRAALVYKPNAQSSVYFSYGTSFNPSAENLALSASNQALPPEKDRTFELGAKAQILDGQLSVTGAIFDTEMTNARITDPLQPTLQSLSGTEKVRGFEAGVQGYLTPQWEITAGYTYLDAKAVGLAGPGIQGPVPNTARNQANLWTTYEVRSWQVGTGLNFTGERQAGTDTQFIPGSVSVPTVPGFITWDAMASYRFSRIFSVQVNALNLTDKFYYMNSYFTRPNENHTVPGAGRTLLVSAHADL